MFHICVSRENFEVSAVVDGVLNCFSSTEKYLIYREHLFSLIIETFAITTVCSIRRSSNVCLFKFISSVDKTMYAYNTTL